MSENKLADVDRSISWPTLTVSLTETYIFDFLLYIYNCPGKAFWKHFHPISTKHFQLLWGGCCPFPQHFIKNFLFFSDLGSLGICCYMKIALDYIFDHTFEQFCMVNSSLKKSYFSSLSLSCLPSKCLKAKFITRLWREIITDHQVFNCQCLAAL